MRPKIDFTKYCFHGYTNYGAHYNVSYHSISDDGNVINCMIIIVDDTKLLCKPYKKIFEI